MQIILKEDVRTLGNAGEVVTVKDGYARTYLIPRDLAVHADPKNLKRLEHERRVLMAQRVRRRKAAESVAATLDGTRLTFHVQTGEDDKMFGSVTSHDVETQLTELGHVVDRRRMGMEQPFHSVGVYTLNVFLHSDVQARVTVWVLPTE